VTDDDDLRINTLHRFAKNSPSLILHDYPVGKARHTDLMPSSPELRRDSQAVTYRGSGCGAANLVASISASGDVNPCSFRHRVRVRQHPRSLIMCPVKMPPMFPLAHRGASLHSRTLRPRSDE
jgi:hypothetical protein